MLFNAFTVMGLAATASAHIIMTNPVPYGDPDNSPLDASGSNFPCKGASNPGGNDNTYKAGSTQKLQFKGTAVHGGGSCQVSVTTDLNPTQDSEWKVIKSIEGGCPAKNTAGNLEGSNAAAEDPYTYEFQIPDEMPSGEYVLAWTWFNKVGNREMYMNCASVKVTGGSDDDAFLSTLPDMLVANAGTDCSTAPDKDVQFPDPGQYLETLNGATTAWAGPLGSCGAAGTTPTSSAAQPTKTAQPTATSEPAASSSQATIPGGGFYTVSSSAAVPAPTSSAAVPTAPAATTSAAVAPAPTSGTGGGSGSHAAGSACTSEGAWDCIDGSSYQRCASGTWSAVMQLAAGTTCKAGESSDMAIAAIKRRALPLRV